MKIFEYKKAIMVFLCIAALLVFSGCAQTSQPDNSGSSGNAAEEICKKQVADARDECIEKLEDESFHVACEEAYNQAIEICIEKT